MHTEHARTKLHVFLCIQTSSSTHKTNKSQTNRKNEFFTYFVHRRVVCGSVPIYFWKIRKSERAKRTSYYRHLPLHCMFYSLLRYLQLAHHVGTSWMCQCDLVRAMKLIHVLFSNWKIAFAGTHAGGGADRRVASEWASERKRWNTRIKKALEKYTFVFVFNLRQNTEHALRWHDPINASGYFRWSR